jgi:hypothetical protein
VTLPPVERMNLVVGLKGERYKVGPLCSNPDCRRVADHVHHIFRRSAIGGDLPWVKIDGWLVGNLTGLCVPCHNEVTGNLGGHRAAIRFDSQTKTFFWAFVHEIDSGLDSPSIDYIRTAPLDPQPPTPETLKAQVPGQVPEPAESEHCPFCGQTRRRLAVARAPEARRRRKSWNVSVPDDSEDGADVLDAFVDEVAMLLGAGDWEERNRRYWALVHVLAWTMQRREEFERDVKAAA